MARVALVTGGTRGIGEAISIALKAAGRLVIANYAANDKAAQAFTEATGIPAIKFDAGNFAACVSWSGDVAQLTLDNPKLRFVTPKEGGMRWADTMCMVKTSKRRRQVGAWIDYFYDPVNAARVANFVQFISPVAGIKAELGKLDPKAPTNPLIFPPADVFAQLKIFRTLGEKEEEKFDTRFAQIIGG